MFYRNYRYIAGNMGYMEGGGMDYSYGNASHYPLWKPPNGYFPRGEAPPPYEEAVAISQAEALSAQCAGVNAAAAAAAVAQQQQQQQQPRNIHAIELSNNNARAGINQAVLANQPQMLQQQTAPLALPITHVTTNTLAPQHQQHQTNQITQSTTNLINININSGGNITTIATGESHQPPASYRYRIPPESDDPVHNIR